MTDNTTDPLESLLIDAEELDRARIASAINELVGIDRNTGAVRPHGPKYRKLSNREKILAILLGVRAAQLIGKRDNEALRASEIPGMAGIREGSTHPTLKSLRENYEVSQTDEGAYYLSDMNVITAIEVLEAARSESRQAQSAPKQPARKKAKRKKSTPSDSSDGNDGAGETVAVGSSGISPSALVKQLIDDGFFSQPRTLADVQQRIRDKRAHKIPVTTLSSLFARLARNETLERNKNDEGVYEYHKPS